MSYYYNRILRICYCVHVDGLQIGFLAVDPADSQHRHSHIPPPTKTGLPLSINGWVVIRAALFNSNTRTYITPRGGEYISYSSIASVRCACVP